MTRRKHPRYEIAVPLEVISMNSQPTVIRAKTHDISTGGVRCHSKTSIQAGATLEYKVTLSSNTPAILIHCKGVVLRSQMSADPDYPFELVFSMQRYTFAAQQPRENMEQSKPATPGEPPLKNALAH